MAMQISCDLCYDHLSVEKPADYMPLVLTDYEPGKAAYPKLKILIHICNKCLLSNKNMNFYVPNPFYVKPTPPPEEIKAESKE